MMNFQRILGVFYRYLYEARKGFFTFTDVIYWPFIDILLWGLTSIWVQSQDLSGQNFPLILMTGLIFWQICWRGSIDISTCLLQEFWQRNLINLFSSPLKFSEWVSGVLLLSICKLFVTISFGAIVVYLLYALNVFSVGWLFLPFAASLLIFGWSLGFLASSVVIYWGHKVEMFAWMIGGLFAPFSAVFYPVSVLPEWAHPISWSLPTTYIFEGMRSILRQGTFPHYYFWISIALDIVFLSIAISFYKFMFEKSRRKGLARLE